MLSSVCYIFLLIHPLNDLTDQDDGGRTYFHDFLAGMLSSVIESDHSVPADTMSLVVGGCGTPESDG